MKINPIRQEGYELLHHGAIELARVEGNGIRIDVKKLTKTKEDLTLKIRTLKQELETTDIWKVWRKRFGERASITSGDQLGKVLYEQLGYQVKHTTEGGKPATDEEALQEINHPDIPKIVRLSKYQKALGTYLKGIEREIVDDRIHPFFHLHLARSFRSSSSDPNFQNQPVRDKEIAEIIRSIFIASVDSVLVENDFTGAEVCLSAAYHHDPVFIDYITTPGKDMHRDMAAQIYGLEPEEVDKDTRYGAKSSFVFPQFYGDYYVACARNLWDYIRKAKLKGPDGKSLYKYLKGPPLHISKLGACDPELKPVPSTFEHHIQEVENDFWNRRFKVYGQWRKDFYADYLDNGYFDILTGFSVYGSYPRNAVTNYPVQGAAFHCLLWCLIRVNRLLRKYKMRSLIVGQIHDSLLGDVRVDELKDYLEIIECVTTVDLRKHYEWLAVPPEIEYEVCPVGGSWFEKKEIKFKQGKFFHPDNPKKFTTDPMKLMEIIGV